MEDISLSCSINTPLGGGVVASDDFAPELLSPTLGQAQPNRYLVSSGAREALIFVTGAPVAASVGIRNTAA